jgi:hypothetical protein
MQKCCWNECGCFEFIPDFVKVPYVPLPQDEEKYAVIPTMNELDYSKLDVKFEDAREPEIKKYYPLVEIKGSLPSHIFLSESPDYLTKHTYNSEVFIGGAINPEPRRGGFGQWNDTTPWDGNGQSHSYRPMNWGELIN